MDHPRNSGTYRAALAAVIILSVAVAAAVIAVVAGFVHQYRIYRAGAASAAPVLVAAPGGAAATLQLAPGTHIISATTDSGRLVLHVQTRAGGAVEIIDMASGKLISEVRDGPPEKGLP